MGFNMAGVIIGGKLSDGALAELLEAQLEYSTDVGSEEAISSFRDENTIDVVRGDRGMLIMIELGQQYDFTGAANHSELIQFMISDVSDTCFFEKYTDGKLVRKFVTTQGDIEDDFGQGLIAADDDFTDKIWAFMDAYVQTNFLDTAHELVFKRYTIN